MADSTTRKVDAGRNIPILKVHSRGTGVMHINGKDIELPEGWNAS